jgi:crotonobetainyl-CoA:carnitine CoA-transferase CaiB-like acyl-CoA transferase
LALCDVLGLGDLATDARFATNECRVENRAELIDRLEMATQARTRADLIKALNAVGVPCGPINSVAEALNDPQTKHRAMQVAPEGVAGIRTPINFGRSTLDLTRTAPTLGNGAWAFTQTPE